LSDTSVTDFSPLYGLTYLRTLDIRGCGISAMELRLLQEAMPGCAIYS